MYSSHVKLQSSNDVVGFVVTILYLDCDISDDGLRHRIIASHQQSNWKLYEVSRLTFRIEPDPCSGPLLKEEHHKLMTTCRILERDFVVTE